MRHILKIFQDLGAPRDRFLEDPSWQLGWSQPEMVHGLSLQLCGVHDPRLKFTGTRAFGWLVDIFFFDGWFQDIPKLSLSEHRPPQTRVVHPSLILAIQLAEPHFSGQLYIISCIYIYTYITYIYIYKYVSHHISLSMFRKILKMCPLWLRAPQTESRLFWGRLLPLCQAGVRAEAATALGGQVTGGWPPKMAVFMGKMAIYSGFSH